MFLIRRKYNDRENASRMLNDMVLWLCEHQGMGDRLRETYHPDFQDMVLPHLDLPEVHWHLAIHGYQEKNWWLSWHSYYDPVLKDGFKCITASVADEYVAIQMMLTL